VAIKKAQKQSMARSFGCCTLTQFNQQFTSSAQQKHTTCEPHAMLKPVNAAHHEKQDNMPPLMVSLLSEI
jgi:hypothetical protein